MSKIIADTKTDEITEESKIKPETKAVCKAPTKPKAVRKAPAKPRKRKYLNNVDLLIQIRLSKAEDAMSHTLAHMLMMLCDGYSKKAKYRNYSYIDDMKSFAMLGLAKNWHKFNLELGDNPFAFYTQCIKRSFKQFLNSEKKQRDVRDMLMVKHGLTPSHTYQMMHTSPPRLLEDYD